MLVALRPTGDDTGRMTHPMEGEATAVQIHLLGTPHIETDGQESTAARGRKAWALLGFLLLAAGPVSRERLSALLFADADDPLGALRWNLTELRRLLGPSVTIGGDPVTIGLPADAYLDVRVLTSGTWVEAVQVPGIGDELLAGLDVSAGPSFDAWLLTERRRLANVSGSVLREAVAARLAAGSADAAVDLATRLVAMDEYDEEAHLLLVHAHLAAGGVEDARRYLEATVDRLRRELGVEPSAALRGALDSAPIPSPGQRGVPSPSAIESLIGAGEAALAAGVFDAGIEILRRSVVDAREAGAPAIEARAQLAVGTAFIHGGRGRDTEGIPALHATLGLAQQLDDATTAVRAMSELGYADMKRGRYERAETWLEAAMAQAADPGIDATAAAVRGVVASDRGDTARAVSWLSGAADDARALDKPRREAWARAFLGRTHLLRDEFPDARREIGRAIDLIQATGWVTFLSFPQSLLGFVALAEGADEQAMTSFEASFALGCQIGDPCWEGMAACGIGLMHERNGRVDEAFAWLDDAQTRCVRIADAYVWVHAYCLDALCRVAVAHGHPQARRWITDLETVAARTGMLELLVRAHLHRAGLGEAGAAETAAIFADQVDNPAIERLLAGHARVGSPAPA